MTKEQLNKLKPAAQLVVYDEDRGRRRVRFVRVTRAGKGNDVMVDVPKVKNGVTTDYTRKVVPIADVLSIVKKPTKPSKVKVRADAELVAWRLLAGDAIGDLREVARAADGELRDKAFRKAAAQRVGKVTDVEGWRHIVENVIRALREIRDAAEDELRDVVNRTLAALERRAATLAGQQELSL